MTTTAQGIRIAVRAQPKAACDAIDGVRGFPSGERLAVKVTAAPDRGRANAAIVALLAKALGVAPTAVTVAGGETGRDKIMAVAGDPAALLSRFHMLARP
ncbi:DUF167 domain-containing protein [Desertibaculum subflavum]|uniref:DUF167 domain-containing protein n=1 Tax=Desertibaculum subflavum TaxID=2268458 RepID=UPI0034D29FCA